MRKYLMIAVLALTSANLALADAACDAKAAEKTVRRRQDQLPEEMREGQRRRQCPEDLRRQGRRQETRRRGQEQLREEVREGRGSGQVIPLAGGLAAGTARLPANP